VRIILPLQRALLPNEFQLVHQEVARRLQLKVDRNTLDVSRIYFLPTTPEGKRDRVIHEHGEGALFDIEEILRTTPAQKVAPTWGQKIDLPPISTGFPSAPVDPALVNIEALRQCLRESDRDDDDDHHQVPTKKELVRRAAEGLPLTTPEDLNVRRMACRRIGKIAARRLPTGVPLEAVTELLRPSVMGMPIFSTDDDREAWLSRAFGFVRDGWAEGAQDKAQADAQRAKDEVANESVRKALTRLIARREKNRNAKTPSKKIEEVTAAEDDDEENELTDSFCEGWEEGISYTKPKKEGDEATVRQVERNAHHILKYHPEWRRTLKLNKVTKAVSVKGAPLQSFEEDPERTTTGTKYWLGNEYGLDLHDSEVRSAILHVATEHAFNPLQKYIKGLQWDGIPRAAMFLETYCAATLKNRNGDDITEHVRRISLRWLVSAIARAMKPGCKVDTVLILEGTTDLYKSTALKVLGGEFFSDSKITIGTNDAMMLAGSNWIHEIAELTSFHASETEVQKAFFSSPTDNFRPPYGHAVIKFPRLCVFVGSTNDERYLNDPTGNRRYWPIHCGGRFQIKKLRQDRDQIWAEAYAVYKAAEVCPECDLPMEHRCEKHRWWLDPDENKVLETVNNFRLKAEYSEAIADYILKLDPKRRPAMYTTFEVAVDVLKLTPDRVSSQQVPIGRALKVLGFEKDRRREYGVLTTFHLVPESLRSAPKRVPGREHLVPVPRPSVAAK
jgi:hypothetical protein